MTKLDILAVSHQYGEPFTHWLDFELDHEMVTDKTGRIIDEHDPGDFGGRTFAGIDQASHPDFPYDNPQPEDVVNEYESDWHHARADLMPAPVGATVANYTVNMGLEPAIKLLQRALNFQAEAIDGICGCKTLDALDAQAVDPESAHQVALKIVALADLRYTWMANHTARLRKFLSGWLNRDRDLRQFDVQN